MIVERVDGFLLKRRQQRREKYSAERVKLLVKAVIGRCARCFGGERGQG